MWDCVAAEKCHQCSNHFLKSGPIPHIFDCKWQTCPMTHQRQILTLSDMVWCCKRCESSGMDLWLILPHVFLHLLTRRRTHPTLLLMCNRKLVLHWNAGFSQHAAWERGREGEGRSVGHRRIHCPHTRILTDLRPQCRGVCRTICLYHTIVLGFWTIAFD